MNKLNLGRVKGDKGDPARVFVKSTTTLAPNSQATVYNAGTSQDVQLEFGIPEGVQGIQGPPIDLIAGDGIEADLTDPSKPVVSVKFGQMPNTVTEGDDRRLSNPRAPTGPAGGVLSGSYPNPDFAEPMATIADLSAGLGDKVDKIAGKGLSENDFTAALKSKLEGLEGTHWRGTFPTLGALQTGVPNPAAGDYADVDGVGSEVKRFVWDANDSQWVEQSGVVPPLTAAQIKQLYESNANTNAFDDSAKSKLAGIQTGAQVNSVTSVAGKTGAVTLAKGDVELSNVNNTSDANKPISTATQTALDDKVSLTANETINGEKLFAKDVASTNAVMSGKGRGGAALTTRDGYGNANVCFNHAYGVPDITGSSARIAVSVGVPAAIMMLQVKNNTTAGVNAGNLNTILSLSETNAQFNVMPATPSIAPTQAYHVANKKYVDDSVMSIQTAPPTPVVIAANVTVTLTNGRAVYAVNTTEAARTLTLPASPDAGARVTVLDYANTFDSNACTIARNGKNIEGGTANLVLKQKGQVLELVYVDATAGWKIISSDRYGGFGL